MTLAQLDARVERAWQWKRTLRVRWFEFSRLKRCWLLAGSWSNDGLGWSGMGEAGVIKPATLKVSKKKKKKSP